MINSIPYKYIIKHLIITYVTIKIVHSLQTTIKKVHKEILACAYFKKAGELWKFVSPLSAINAYEHAFECLLETSIFFIHDTFLSLV